MKTQTILSAWEATVEFLRLNDPFVSNPQPGKFCSNKRRQCRVFRARLLSRIESGDRAREALDELANNWYSLDSDEGKSILEDVEP